MKQKTLFLAAVVVVILAGITLAGSTDSAQQERLKTLKELRDSGVLTEEEYQAKLREQAGNGTAAAPANSDGGNGLSSAMRMLQVGDPGYQMQAGTIQVPGDWKFSGIMNRSRGCHANSPQLQYFAESADGLMAIQHLPGLVWRDTTNPNLARIMARQNCPPVGISTAADFLQQVVLPMIRPGATLDRMDPPYPADGAMLEENFRKMQQNAYQQAIRLRQMGMRNARPAQHMLDAAIGHIHFSINGHEVEEAIGVGVHCVDMFVPPNFVQGPSINRNCNSYPVVIVRAPRGRLEDLRLSILAIERSWRIDNLWFQRLIADQNAAFQQMQAASWAAHYSGLQNQQQIFDAQMRGLQAADAARAQSVNNSILQARAQQNAMDRQAHEVALWALDKGTYVNPQTGLQYEISNQYARQYIGSDGTVVQGPSDFDPNGSTPGTWYDPLFKR